MHKRRKTSYMGADGFINMDALRQRKRIPTKPIENPITRYENVVQKKVTVEAPSWWDRFLAWFGLQTKD